MRPRVFDPNMTPGVARSGAGGASARVGACAESAKTFAQTLNSSRHRTFLRGIEPFDLTLLSRLIGRDRCTIVRLWEGEDKAKMAHATLARRESLVTALKARRLDRTLTTALPSLDPHNDACIGATGIDLLDAPLGGGFPRGQLSELVGARSSGRTSVLMTMLA